VNDMKNESVVTTKCPEIMSIASQVQNELNSRCQWSKNKTNVLRNFGISKRFEGAMFEVWTQSAI